MLRSSSQVAQQQIFTLLLRDHKFEYRQCHGHPWQGAKGITLAMLSGWEAWHTLPLFNHSDTMRLWASEPMYGKGQLSSECDAALKICDWLGFCSPHPSHLVAAV